MSSENWRTAWWKTHMRIGAGLLWPKAPPFFSLVCTDTELHSKRRHWILCDPGLLSARGHPGPQRTESAPHPSISAFRVCPWDCHSWGHRQGTPGAQAHILKPRLSPSLPSCQTGNQCVRQRSKASGGPGQVRGNVTGGRMDVQCWERGMQEEGDAALTRPLPLTPPSGSDRAKEA